jgi:hypothetical protein
VGIVHTGTGWPPGPPLDQLNLSHVLSRHACDHTDASRVATSDDPDRIMLPERKLFSRTCASTARTCRRFRRRHSPRTGTQPPINRIPHSTQDWRPTHIKYIVCTGQALPPHHLDISVPCNATSPRSLRQCVRPDLDDFSLCSTPRSIVLLLQYRSTG